MENEKERWRQQGEEKESNDAEDDTRSDDDDADNEDPEGASLVFQEGYREDSLSIPIMHWEALSLHIAELEKQEEEKKKTAKEVTSLERGRAPVSWREEKGRRAHSTEEGEYVCTSPVLALTSRLQTHMNLQLCFINDSESEEEEEKTKGDIRTTGGDQSTTAAAQLQSDQPPAKPEKRRGFKNTLRNLRERLRMDHRALNAARCNPVIHGKHLELCDLQSLCLKELRALCASLSQAIQDLSSELVSRLQVRDELRMEQDAMLLEVQDLTSV